MKQTLIVLVSVLVGMLIVAIYFAETMSINNARVGKCYEYLKSRHGKAEADRIMEYVQYHVEDKRLRGQVERGCK